jgi:hypothetical protein
MRTDPIELTHTQQFRASSPEAQHAMREAWDNPNSWYISELVNLSIAGGADERERFRALRRTSPIAYVLIDRELAEILIQRGVPRSV